MGNPLQSIPNLPPAISLDGSEQTWINQAGVDRRASLALLATVGGKITGSGITVSTYAAIRAGIVVQDGSPQSITLADPYKGGVFMPGPKGMRDNGGTVLVDVLGQTWLRIYSGRVNAAWFWNAPGTHHFGDGSGLGITAADQAANPQWIGLPDESGPYPVGVTWAYVTLQEWIYCLAADASVPGNVTWNSQSVPAYTKNRPGFCPPGTFPINWQLIVVGTGLDIEFSGRQASVIQWLGNQLATSNVGPAISFNAISYSNIKSLTVFDSMGVTNYLVSLDFHASPGVLATQANTFTDWFFSGRIGAGVTGVMSQAAIALAPLGTGSAQGDTQIFVNLFLVNFFYDGVVISGSNALCALFLGGNLQGCYRRGIYVRSGSYGVVNMVTEMVGSGFFNAPQQNHLTLDGADFYALAGPGASTDNTVMGVRSESMVMGIDLGNHTFLINDSIVPNATTNPWAANAHWQIGAIINAATGAGYSMVALVDDGGPAWFQSDAASTTTHIINPANPGWAVNQWAGMGVWLRFGSNGVCNSNGIASSDANSLTTTTAFSVSGSHLFKIFGSSGPTQPNWAAVTPFGRALRNATGQGFTTTVGSNLVTAGSGMLGASGMQVGHWVMICGAQALTQSLSPTQIGPLIGKVAAIAGTTITLVDNQGNPVNAGVALTDAMGYWGQGITDGQLTWLPLDWDVVWGMKRVLGCSLPLGRAAACGDMQLDAAPYGGLGGNFIRNNEGAGVSYNYRTTPQVWLGQSLVAIAASPQTVAVGGAGIGTAQTLRYNYTIPAVTVNFPTLGDGVVEEFDLLMQCGNAAGVTITWGTNVLAAAPTVSLGAVTGKVVLARMKWIGNRIGGGSWYVASLQGPM